MRAILLVAHGSRRDSANREVHALADKLQNSLNHCKDSHSVVSSCFLELAEPSIETGLSLLVSAGAKHIQVFPYFLTEGRHVREDIPKIINRYIEQLDVNSAVTIETLPYLGADNRLLNTMMDVLHDSAVPKE